MQKKKQKKGEKMLKTFTVEAVAKQPMQNRTGKYQQGMKLKEKGWINVIIPEGMNIYGDFKANNVVGVDLENEDSVFVDITMIRKMQQSPMTPEYTKVVPEEVELTEIPVPVDYRVWCDTKRAKIADCLNLLKETNVPPEGWQAAMAQITSWIK